MTTTEIGIDEIATKSQLQNVLVRMIRRDGGTQARTGNNEETIELYAEAMRDGRWEWNEANAVVVYHDGSATWLADGFHRVEACFRADQDRVFARVIPGTRRDAVLYAAGANAQHGLRRTRADVRRAIEVLLRDAEWGKWSNAEIARRAKTTDKTVSTVRSELELSSEIPRIEERTVTRNGSTYTQAAARPATPPAPPAPTEAIRSVAYAAEIAGIYRQRIAATETTAELDVIKKEIAADMRLSPSGVIDLAAQISSRLTAAPPASPAAPAEPVAPTITTTSPLDAVSEALRKNDTKAAYAAIHLISNDEERKRAYAAVDARIDGKSLDTVLSMLEQPTTPALSAFPPGSVEAGIGAIARRLQSGSQISTDAPWAEKLRIQLDAARETMQPAVYESWAARLDAVQAALEKLKTQQRKPIRCAHCGSEWLVLIGFGRFCQSCYSLAEAQKWESGSEDMRWRLKNALTAAWSMTDETIRASCIIEIKQVAATHKIDLDAPIIEAPMAAPVATPVANTKKPRLILLQHAEDVLAGLIERSSPAELRLIYALFISTRSSNVSDDLWNYGRNRLDVMNKELEWIVGDVPTS